MTSLEIEPVLAVASLTAGYSGTPAVRDLSLEARSGEVVALLGANGAGKTTTLSTIAGLIAPIAGSVQLDGVEIGGRPADRVARLGVALVPEGRGLFFDLTVREHLRLGRRRRRALPEATLVELMPELEKCLDRKTGVLSGGEQQMVAIGRALISRPRLLLVDELSLGLAPVVVQRLMPLLRRAADDLGTAVVFVEQHVAVALEVADRGYVLEHGHLTLQGTANELRTRFDLLKSSYLGESTRAPAPPEQAFDQTSTNLDDVAKASAESPATESRRLTERNST